MVFVWRQNYLNHRFGLSSCKPFGFMENKFTNAVLCHPIQFNIRQEDFRPVCVTLRLPPPGF